MILQGFILGLTAALILGVVDIVAVVIARRIGTMSILVWTNIGGLVVSTPYLLLVADLELISLVYLPALGALVFFVLLAVTSFYKAIQTSPVTLVNRRGISALGLFLAGAFGPPPSSLPTEYD